MNRCTSVHWSVKLLKFTDDTTSIGVCLQEKDLVDNLVDWCSQKNLELNALKILEIVERKKTSPLAPISFCVASVESSIFLGTIPTQELKWGLKIISLTSKA